MHKSAGKKLDRADRAIIDELSGDARTTNLALAERVSLSPAACLRRVKQLEENDVIRSYTTVINRKSLGLEVEAFVQISLERQAPENVRHMHETISRMPEVRECYVMTGSIDYLLHIVTTSLDAFADLISKTVLMLPGVKDVRSSFVLKCTKREPGLYVV